MARRGWRHACTAPGGVSTGPACGKWNLSLASRETAELRAETLQMGYSLAQLLGDLRLIDAPRRELLAALTPCSFVCVYALAAVAMDIGETATLIGLMWSWLENQVAAAIKVVPLGQLAGQRLLAALSPRLPVLAARAGRRGDRDGQLRTGAGDRQQSPRVAVLETLPLMRIAA
jgi:Urease accessory protein UreF